MRSLSVPLIALLPAALLSFAPLLATTQLAQADTAKPVALSVDGHPLSFTPPDGVCVLDRSSDPADAAFLDGLQQGIAASNRLAAAFADCTTLNDWRRGKTSTLESYGLIMVALRNGAVKPVVGVSLPGYLDALQTDAPTTPWETLRDAANATAASADTGTSAATGSVRDDAAVYLPAVARLRLGDAATGKRVVRAFVEASTLAASLPVTITLYQPWDKDALDGLLARDKVVAANLIAGNPSTDATAAAAAAPATAPASDTRQYLIAGALGLAAGALVAWVIKRRRTAKNAQG